MKHPHDPELYDRPTAPGRDVSLATDVDVEQLAETDTYPVEGTAIGEGDITSGLSGERTHWGPDPLEAADENGVLARGKFLKGQGGQGHKEMDALADPDNIVGSYDVRYEEGEGIVYDGELIDERMATLIDNNLVEISPDLYRQLGDYNPDVDAYEVEEILGMPYITILDRGAVPSNSIETAEALADAGVDWSDKDAEQLGPLYTIRFHGYGEFIGEEYVDEAVSDLDAVPGITAVSSTVDGDIEDPELIAVIDREGANLDALNDSIVDALEDTPFEVFEGFDWVERVSSERLAQASIDVPDAVDADEQPSDEGAESSTATTRTQTTNTDMGKEEPSKAELREQLAEVKAEKAQAETQVETLESKTENLESELEEKEEAIDEKEQAIEEKEEEIDRLESENEPLRKSLSKRAAADSALSPEAIENSNMTNEELADSIVEAEDLGDDDDERSPTEIVAEQLAASPEPRGQAGDEDDPSTNHTEEQLTRANNWAYEALTGQDILRAGKEEQLSPRKLATEQTGVDPADCDSRAEFVRRVNAADEGGEA